MSGDGSPWPREDGPSSEVVASCRMLGLPLVRQRTAARTGVPLSLGPKRTLSPSCSKEFFWGIGITQRPQFTPRDGLCHGKVVASEHVEMLVSQW